jgi:hypothetical protein
MARLSPQLAETASQEYPGAHVANGFPLVEFDRAPIDRYLLRGFALAWTADLTVIQIVEDKQYRLNGYAIFRNSDVKRWRPIPSDGFYGKAAIIHELRPEPPVGVTIVSMKEALASAGRVFPLVTIHRERTDHGACYVGKVHRTSQRAVSLILVSHEGEWEGEQESYSLKDITLVEFGGAYERLLDQMALTVPAAPKPRSSPTRHKR